MPDKIRLNYLNVKFQPVHHITCLHSYVGNDNLHENCKVKKVLLWLVILGILGIGSWYYFQWWKTSRATLWIFVPDTSIAVFEPVNLTTLFNASEERKILQNLKSLPGITELQQQFDLLDSLDIEQNVSAELFNTDKLLISVHRGDKSAMSLACLFLIEINDLKMHDYFGQIQKYLVNDLGFELSSRNYQGYSINEFSNGDTQLAYIFYKNFLIASFNPFLVEDAIRMLDKGRENVFNHNEEFEQAKAQKLFGEGRLYIQQERFAKTLDRLLKDTDLNASGLEHFTELAYLDVEIDQDKVEMTGFAILDTLEANFLSAFSGVRGSTFRMKDFIPDHASLVVHMSFDGMQQLFNGLNKYWRKHNPGQLSRLGELENRYGFDRKRFYDLVDGEIGMFVLDSKSAFIWDKIFAIKHKDHVLADQVFSSLAKAARSEEGSYSETYAGRLIGHIKIEDIPVRLFGDTFRGFNEAYYYVTDNYVFLGSSRHALEVLIDDIDSENTWRKSIKTNSFLEDTNDDANFSIYTKGEGFWNIVNESLDQDWVKYIRQNGIVFNQLEYAALQFTNVDENFYTNLSIHHPGKLVQMQEPQNFRRASSFRFDKRLISKPFSVRNHNDRTLEMMVQDSAFNLHLITSSNQNALTIPLKEQVVGTIYQVDYYKNGKLQYLFALPHSIHMIDRTGSYIPGYPVKVPSDQPVKFLSLIDYDGSKEYRIMAATQRSYYYLFDKTGRVLKGWAPKKLTGAPQMPGYHLRVRGTDFMLFLQGDGIVHGLNRNGLGKKGFPIDLKGVVSSPLHIGTGGSLSTSELVAVTENGDLVEFNLLGGVLRRDQFNKDDLEDKFRLINSHDDKKYLVVKESKDKMVLFNEHLEQLFEVSISSPSVDLQYYDFGSGNEVVTLIDKENMLSYLYSGEGVLLHKEPLESGYRLAMLYHENGDKYEIYCSTLNELRRLTLDR